MSITVEPTTDESFIKSVFLNPSIYAEMKDDSCPESPVMLAGADIKAIPGIFLKVLRDASLVGCFWLIWRGNTLEAHTALMAACRGRAAVVAARKAMEWVWAHTRAVAVTSYAWSDSPSVAWFCRAVGMAVTSTTPWPATRNGRAVDITYFTINRPEGA